ncbi:DNA translocase FtsK [Bacteroidetes bacterium endosymbiont of Geopemphigus sp.]|nr:DNA translocase FtsK [Bacteroidetes bacterium endosymbiont of Geopemphigus sp.]
MSEKPAKISPKKKNPNLFKTITGLLFITGGIVLFLSFCSFFLHWQEDQSQLRSFLDKSSLAKNIFGKIGAFLGDFFIYKGLGLGAFVLPVLFFLIGLRLWKISRFSLKKFFLNTLFFSVFLPMVSGFILPEKTVLSGILGFEVNSFLSSLTGALGLGMLLFISLMIYIILLFKISPERFTQLQDFSLAKAKTQDVLKTSKPPQILTSDNASLSEKMNLKTKPNSPVKISEDEKESVEMIVGNPEKKADPAEQLQKYEQSPLLQRTGEREDFTPPTLELLKPSKGALQDIAINQKELEVNKDKIVDTLRHYKIGIKKIKATIGPSVTLYEIIPQDGIRISKIKGLEDDIALNLAALGIRIIAPIPGRGTIGIEVPNSNPAVVFIHSVLSSEKFRYSKMELPIVLGKTISNETFMADLAKMPHLLMAGATGQGKSVGLNAIIVALLYKKSPKDLKFVMIDPKKVELSLYKKIERYYLAKVPDTKEAIITDTSQAKDVLNSLCKEMDRRYDLLKQAMVRHIKEYNAKAGHMPYIVLIVDEFADLIMTAGREIEIYIARLAQLARAVGIHLIIATQRPSVNVITGLIKANFPARIAFRVTSKIDSRTILDVSGAEQLIGKGDMLFSNGNELIRLQCPFIETHEVEEIVNFYESKKIDVEQWKLPKPDQQESKGDLPISSFGERDPLFGEAARLVVSTQQGSTSLLQRKLSVGYSRAAKIVDQLEENGILGPFEGSKARQVLLSDIESLQSPHEKK